MSKVINHDNIPASLRAVDKWCIWNGDKIPKSPLGHPLKSTEPDSWHDFDLCMAEYVCGGASGVGFCLTDSGIVGIDLDDCLVGGVLRPWGGKVLALMPEGAYIEVSPSGNGLHILLRGKKPGISCKKHVKSKAGEHLGVVEIYDTARYFTVTGDTFDGSGPEVVDGQEAIDLLYGKLFGAEGTATPAVELGKAPAVPAAKPPPNNLTAEEVISTILGSSQAPKFVRLVSGTLETALMDYANDHSRAAYALTAIIAWYTGDFAVCDTIFRDSPLYAGKWAPNREVAGGKTRQGKWSRLGKAQFAKQRAGYEALGDYYGAGGGKVAPSEDFALTGEAAAERDKVASGIRYLNIVETFGSPKRDLLSGSLHIKSIKTDIYEPVFTKSLVGAIRWAVRQEAKGLKPAELDDFLCNLEQSLEPQILIDAPMWDGDDRIGMMCSKLKLENVKGEIFTDLFKDWCSKMYAKMLSPFRVQNRCILLSGRQGVGKDVWYRSLFGAMEGYFKDLVTQGKYTTETDLSVVMGQAAILCISEFDKIKCLGAGVLKDLITKPAFTQVRKYDRDATTTPNRCSVLAACNPEQILDDSTGNRRFLIFRLAGGPGEAISWAYPTESRPFSLQVIAQCKALADSKYKASTESELVMRGIQEEHTPESANDLIIADFESAIIERAKRDELSNNPGLYRIDALDVEFNTICKNHGIKRQSLLHILKDAGCQKRKRIGRYYGTRAAVCSSDTESEEHTDKWEEGFN
jgi:hypothetical protein